jgi:hypothetical protein
MKCINCLAAAALVLLAASSAVAQTASTVASNNSDTASDDRTAPDHVVVVIFENHSYADNLASGAYTVPSGYVSPPCLPSGTPAEPEFDQLRALASQLGFPKF